MHDFNPSRIVVAAVICLCSSSPTRSRIQKARTYPLSERNACGYYTVFGLSVPLSDKKPIRWTYQVYEMRGKLNH